MREGKGKLFERFKGYPGTPHSVRNAEGGNCCFHPLKFAVCRPKRVQLREIFLGQNVGLQTVNFRGWKQQFPPQHYVRCVEFQGTP